MTALSPATNGALPSARRHVVLAHGGGGQLTDELVGESILPRLGNGALNQLLDSGLIDDGNGRLALTTDGYVVTPWQFPGGNIGNLAVCGTVNDLAVTGAKPLGIALGLIVAEGFAKADLHAVLDAIAESSNAAGVPIITGDTKVVGAKQADGIYITTSGIGRIPPGRELSPNRVQPGDVLIVNGPVGEHGLAVMLKREMPEVQSVLTTDAAPLNGLIDRLLDACGDDVAFMRDPTRSGVAGVAADLASTTGLHVTLDEAAIPIRPEANHAAEMLGLDPLEIANEGKLIAVVRPDAADKALNVLRENPYGQDAAVIGRIDDEADGLCEIQTTIGGRRILQKPYGEQLPRIC
jgi:hydrogenase expression/formation protein HypE